jgi:dihydrofolate reductase
MRKVIVSMFVTLDGVMEAPDKWSFQFWNDEQAKFKFDELFASDTLLLGRVTYQGFAAAWPHMAEEGGEYAYHSLRNIHKRTSGALFRSLAQR